MEESTKKRSLFRRSLGLISPGNKLQKRPNGQGSPHSGGSSRSGSPRTSTQTPTTNGVNGNQERPVVQTVQSEPARTASPRNTEPQRELPPPRPPQPQNQYPEPAPQRPPPPPPPRQPQHSSPTILSPRPPQQTRPPPPPPPQSRQQHRPPPPPPPPSRQQRRHSSQFLQQTPLDQVPEQKPAPSTSMPAYKPQPDRTSVYNTLSNTRAGNRSSLPAQIYYSPAHKNHLYRPPRLSGIPSPVVATQTADDRIRDALTLEINPDQPQRYPSHYYKRLPSIPAPSREVTGSTPATSAWVGEGRRESATSTATGTAESHARRAGASLEEVMRIQRLEDERLSGSEGFDAMPEERGLGKLGGLGPVVVPGMGGVRVRGDWSNVIGAQELDGWERPAELDGGWQKEGELGKEELVGETKEGEDAEGMGTENGGSSVCGEERPESVVVLGTAEVVRIIPRSRAESPPTEFVVYADAIPPGPAPAETPGDQKDEAPSPQGEEEKAPRNSTEARQSPLAKPAGNEVVCSESVGSTEAEQSSVPSPATSGEFTSPQTAIQVFSVEAEPDLSGTSEVSQPSGSPTAVLQPALPPRPSTGSESPENMIVHSELVGSTDLSPPIQSSTAEASPVELSPAQALGIQACQSSMLENDDSGDAPTRTPPPPPPPPPSAMPEDAPTRTAPPPPPPPPSAMPEDPQSRPVYTVETEESLAGSPPSTPRTLPPHAENAGSVYVPSPLSSTPATRVGTPSHGNPVNPSAHYQPAYPVHNESSSPQVQPSVPLNGIDASPIGQVTQPSLVSRASAPDMGHNRRSSLPDQSPHRQQQTMYNASPYPQVQPQPLHQRFHSQPNMQIYGPGPQGTGTPQQTPQHAYQNPQFHGQHPEVQSPQRFVAPRTYTEPVPVQFVHPHAQLQYPSTGGSDPYAPNPAPLQPQAPIQRGQSYVHYQHPVNGSPYASTPNLVTQTPRYGYSSLQHSIPEEADPYGQTPNHQQYQAHSQVQQYQSAQNFAQANGAPPPPSPSPVGYQPAHVQSAMKFVHPHHTVHPGNAQLSSPPPPPPPPLPPKIPMDAPQTQTPSAKENPPQTPPETPPNLEPELAVITRMPSPPAAPAPSSTPPMPLAELASGSPPRSAVKPSPSAPPPVDPRRPNRLNTLIAPPESPLDITSPVPSTCDPSPFSSTPPLPFVQTIPTIVVRAPTTAAEAARRAAVARLLAQTQEPIPEEREMTGEGKKMKAMYVPPPPPPPPGVPDSSPMEGKILGREGQRTVMGTTVGRGVVMGADGVPVLNTAHGVVNGLPVVNGASGVMNGAPVVTGPNGVVNGNVRAVVIEAARKVAIQRRPVPQRPAS